jgi:uncharacterized protein YgiM (DUF1202 family)
MILVTIFEIRLTQPSQVRSKVMKSIITFFALIFCFVILAPNAAHAAELPTDLPSGLQDASGVTAVVNFDRLSLRRGPNFNASTLGALPLGATLTVLGKSETGYWIKVNSPLGVGWVARPYIRMTASLSMLPIVYVDKPFADVIAEPAGNLRVGPSTEYPVVQELPTGTEVDVVGKQQQPRWYKVVHPDGSVGWVWKDVVVTVGQDQQIPVTTALPMARITGYRVNVRTAPSLQGGVIGLVGLDQLFTIVGVDAAQQWYQIQGKFGTGWINARYVAVIGSLAPVTQTTDALQ